MVDDRNTAQFAGLGVDSAGHCVTGSLQSLPVVPTTQMGLVGVARDTDHTACFTDVNVMVEAAGIIATASRIQEGAANTNHGGPDKEQKVWRFRVIYHQRLLKGPTRPNNRPGKWRLVSPSSHTLERYRSAPEQDGNTNDSCSEKQNVFISYISLMGYRPP